MYLGVWTIIFYRINLYFDGLFDIAAIGVSNLDLVYR